MNKEKPIKLYFLITFLLIILIVYFGLVLKNFLSEKLPSRDVKEEGTTKKPLPKEIQQSRAIFSLAAIILFVLVIMFIMFKISPKNK